MGNELSQKRKQSLDDKKDLLINRCRVLLNHIHFMKDDAVRFAVYEVNKELDEYYQSGGRFLDVDIVDWLCDIKKR